MGTRVKIGPGFQTNDPHHIIIGDHVYIDAYCNVMAVASWKGEKYNPLLEIGHHTTIGRFAHITCVNKVRIGSNVMFAERVFIGDHDHAYKEIHQPILHQPLSRDGVTEIGDGCWLGVGCVILKDVHIGKHCVIGSNSVVTKDIPAYSVAVGIPARVIQQYDHATGTWIHV